MRRRPGPGLDEKLLALVLHQMHILTDLLESHLWDTAGQQAALGHLATARNQKQYNKRVPRGPWSPSTGRERQGTEGRADRKSPGTGRPDSAEDRSMGNQGDKERRATHWSRRPRPLSVPTIAVAGGARATKRTWGCHRADSTKPSGAGAVHRLQQKRRARIHPASVSLPPKRLPPIPSSVPTCNSSRWICSESSWISESKDRAELEPGGVNTSSFRGALQSGEG